MARRPLLGYDPPMAMKKLINDPRNVVQELIEGFVLANEGSAEALADWIGRFVITEDVAFGSIAERPWTLAIDGRSERLCEGPAPEQGRPPAFNSRTERLLMRRRIRSSPATATLSPPA